MLQCDRVLSAALFCSSLISSRTLVQLCLPLQLQRVCGLIEGGDNFLGEMSWPVAWDRVGVGDTPCTLYKCGVERWSIGEKIAAPVEGASTQQRSRL